jgi:phosphatidate cytidylyltransferase
VNSNLIKRSISGLLFVILLVGSIVYGSVTFVALFALFSAFTTYELTGLLNDTQKVTVNRPITALGSFYHFIAMAGYVSDNATSVIFIPYLAIMLYLFIQQLYLKHENPIGNLSATMLSQFYVGLNFALINALSFVSNEGGLYVDYYYIMPLALFIFIWVNDTGAYCVGSLLGKRKLFPRISPNKSWEGSIGGGISTLIAAAIIASISPILSYAEWMGFGLVVAVFGTWGDLIESRFKRQLKIKDSGNILPGHGGFLDRFDSTLIAIPAVVFYIYLIKMF